MHAPAAARPFDALDRAFEQALTSTVAGATEVSVLFSGGVDSALVAHGAARSARVEALVIATPSGRDRGAAEEAARLLDLPLRSVTLTRELVEATRAGSSAWLEPLVEPARSVQLALRLAVGATRSHRVLTGQGADELFGGYAHFRGLDPGAADLQRARDLRRLREDDWPLSQRVARSIGRDLRSPFLVEEFVRVAESIPIAPTVANGLTKSTFRDWARHRGLPTEICGRAKRALQYGSGVARLSRPWAPPVEGVRPASGP